MAGQIGIKTNLVLDKSKLDSQIEKIQEILAKKNTFKIDVDKESINNLKEIHKIVKDIVKAIDFDLDDFKKKIKSASSSSSDVGFGDTSMLQQQANEQDKVLEKSANNKMNLMKTTKVFQDGILKQEKMDFINAEKEKYSAVLRYTQDGISVTESLEKKSGGSRLKELRKELESIQKSFKNLGKIDGFKDMPDFGNLFRSMNKLDKAYSGDLKVFDTKGYEKLKETLASLGEAYEELSKKANGKKDSLDVTKSILNSRKAVKQLLSEYQSLKRAVPEFDPDGSILNQISDVESKMEKINKTSTGTGSNAFKELDISITKAKDSLEIYSKEFDSMLNKDKKIEALRNKLSTLEIFADKGVLDSSTISRFKDSIESLSNIKDPREFALALNNITKELNQSEKGAKQAERAMRGLGNESHGIKKLSDALAKMGIYFSAWRITSEIFQEFKRGIKTVSELDNQIVQVGIDMNVTASESRNLLKESQRIATETGIGIEEIVRVAGVYSNQTETMASVLAKVKPSAILAGVADASATEITDMFQGVVNQYKLAKDDIEKTSYEISDSIIGVSKNIAQNFDTSVKEISEVMLDAGAVMNELGYTYQETMAMAGAVMEVTRQTGSELSGAFRMIGARIGGAKNSGEDLNPEDISNAAKAYKSVGIEIINADGSFKDMKDTLKELSLVWDSLTDVERSYIAEQSAGNRRRNTFMVMMDTMGKQTELTNIALNSQGDTLAANEKYLTSTAAKMQNFTNAMDSLWQDAISSEAIKNVLDFGTALIGVVDNIGAVNIALMSMSTYLVATGKIKFAMKSLKDGFFNLQVNAGLANKSMLAYTTSTIAANAASMALQATVTFGLSFAITALVSWLIKLGGSYESTSKKAKRLGDEIEDVKNKTKSVEEIYKKIKSTQDEIDKSNSPDSNKSEEEKIALKEELLNLQRQLASLSPETISNYDSEGNAIASSNDLIKEQIALLKELETIKAKDWLNTKGYTKDRLIELEQEGRALEDRAKQLKEMMDAGETEAKTGLQTQDASGNWVDEYAPIVTLYQEILEKSKDYNESLSEIVKNIKASGDESLEALIPTIVNLGLAEKQVKKASEGFRMLGGEIRDITRSNDELDKSIKKSTESMDELQSIIDEIEDKDFDGISGKSVEILLEKYPTLIQYINDEVKLREELKKKYDEEKQSSTDALSVKLANIASEGKAHFSMMNNKVSNDKEWYRVNVLNNKELIKTFNDLYGLDLKNFTTLQNAKTEMDRRYINTATSNYNNFFNRLFKAYGEAAMAADDSARKINEQRRAAGLNTTIDTDYDGGTGWNKQFTAMRVTTSALNAISWAGVNPSAGTGSGSTSGKDSEKTKYESDKAYFNKHTALIEEYQRQLDILANKIDTTTERIAYYKEVGNDESLNNALMLQNRLYQEQADKLNLLKNAQAGMVSGQKEINNYMSKFGINMSTQTAEDLNYWLDKLYPQITSTNQAVVDAQNTKREQFKIAWDSYMDYASELVSIESEIVSMQGTLLDTLKDKYETEFTMIDRRLENFNKRTEEIARRMQLLNDSSSYNERESLTTDSLSSLTAYKSELEVSIKGLKDKLSMLNSASAEWTIINDKLKEYEGILHETNVEILQTQQNLKSIRDEELSNSMSLLDKIASSVRKQYEEAKKAELSALKATLDAEVDVKRKELKILQDRLDALNDTTEDKESELKALKDEAKMWENDNSVYAKSKLAELEKLIKEKEKDLEKDRIQKEMDNLEDEIQKTEDANQEKVDAVEESYEKLLSEQNIYHQASLILMNSSQEEILKLLLEYDDKYKGMGSVLGKAFAEGLMEEVLKGLDSFDSLSDGLVGKNMIPWMQSLPSGYSYNASGSVNAKSIGITSQIGIPSIPMDTQLESLSANYLKMMSELGNFKSSIENMTLNMDVKFYTNGQLDVERSIKSLEGLFQDSLAGSGSMFKLNR